MKLAITLGLTSIVLVVAAIVDLPVAILLVWAAVSFCVLALGYAGLGVPASVTARQP